MGSVRYSSLLNREESGDEDEDLFPSHQMEFGSAPGTFESAFTYAKYGDLDRMGYDSHSRNMRAERSNKLFTYTPKFDDSEEWRGEGGTIVEKIIVLLSFVLITITLPLSLLFSLRFVSTHEKLVVLRLGRAQKTRGPGTHLLLPCIDKGHRVDTRITAFNVPPLNIITADRGLIEMGATVYLRVRDPLAAVCQVQDRNSSMRTLASSMLYRYSSKKRICELTGGHDRRHLAALFKDELGHFTSQFGVEITEVELSDIKVVKEAENMGLASLSAVAKSEVGQHIWNVIGPTLEEIAKETKSCQNKVERESTGPSTIGDLVDLHSTSYEEDVDIDRLITIVNMGIDQSLVFAIGKIYQLECEGVDQIVVDLRKGICYKGVAPSADVVLTIDRKWLVPLLKLEISPLQAYSSGKVKISGSIQDTFSLRLLTDRIAHLL
ncbi:hypothetical protein PMAYCL1PPCAC_18311 [Pristionchus mayeri]|uniref:Band 7 domain-containing protein n=1 Tax=Pristionchus mayeri TaxID=1317129 RepID=A0AAN5CP92_9BILA|nr:hypothetical protein PMAYCL1PPCAC_18311 [Pristionchus mayeri]